jgi:hypothetical protein
MAAMGLSHPGAVAVATAGVVATGIGALWWHAAGGGEAPGKALCAAVTVGASLLGGFVLWDGPGNRTGRVHLAVGFLFGSVVLAAGALGPPDGLPVGVGRIVMAWSGVALPLLLPLWVMVIAAFPDGLVDRFSRGQTTSGGPVPECARRGVLAALSTSLPQPGPPRLQGWRARFPEWRQHHGQDLSLVPMVFDRLDEGLSRALVYRGWWLAGASLARHPPHRLADFVSGRCRSRKDLAKWPPASVFQAC